jgi:hypothetical protein
VVSALQSPFTKSQITHFFRPPSRHSERSEESAFAGKAFFVNFFTFEADKVYIFTRYIVVIGGRTGRGKRANRRSPAEQMTDATNGTGAGKTFILEYSSPQFGSLKVPLRSESLAAYRFICSAEPHGVRRYEKLDHLGLLRAVHKSAHHSRWEYLMTQMYFVHFFDKESRSFGFSSRVSLSPTTEVSSVSEFLKSLILLYSYGHLWRTFEAERVWLQILRQRPKIRRAFYNGLPDDESRGYADSVLERENFYTLFKVMGLFLLEMGRREHRHQRAEGPHNFAMWIEILKSSFRSHPPGSTLDRAFRAFRHIRTISYTFLDLEFCQAFLKISPILLLQQLQSQPDEFLSDEAVSISKLLDDLGVMLFETLYGSPEVSAYKRLYFDEQMRKFERLVDRRGITFFYKDEHVLLQRLKQAKENDFGEVLRPDPMLKPFIRVRMLPNEYVGRSRCLWLKEEERLLALSAKAKVRYLVTPVPFRQNHGSILDVYLNEGATWGDKSTAAYRALHYIWDCYKSLRNYPGGLYEFSTEEAYRGLFAALMAHVFGASYRIRIEEATTPLDYPVSALYGQKDRRGWARVLNSEARKASFSSDRKWELTALKAVLSDEGRGIILACTGNVKLYDDSWRGVAEFDGVYLKVLRRSMHLTIIEAKRGIQRSSRQALNQLQESLGRLGVDPHSKRLKFHRRRGLAYVKACLPLPS